MPARRSGLGRGLDALIPAAPEGPIEGSEGGGTLRDLPIDAIDPNRYQPRASFHDGDLDDLAASIGALGVLQPLLVRGSEGGRYELIAGERRLRAARQAGLTSVPAVVRTVEDQAALEQALVENLQRSDLNAMEEALAFRRLMDEFSLTQEAVAARVGRSRSTVANTLRLLHLAPRVQEHVRTGTLSGGHARAVLAVDGAEAQQELADRAIAEGWSVRRTEDEVRAATADPAAVPADEAGDAGPPPADAPPAGGGDPSPGATTGAKSAALLELELLLADHLDTRVQVQMAGGGHRVAKGKIVVEFAGIEDLERIYRAMSGGGVPEA